MKHTLTKKTFNTIDTISALSCSAGIFSPISEDFDLHRIEDYKSRYLDSLGIHYNGFHQVALVTRGTATVSINDFRCNVQAGKLLFMTAGSAQKWEASEDIAGYRLLFMPKYFARFLSFGNWTFSPYIFLESSFCQMDLHTSLAEELAILMEQILFEAEETYNSNAGRNEIIDQLNLLILLKLKRIKPNGTVQRKLY